MISSPGPVIDAHHRWRRKIRNAVAANDAQRRVIADRDADAPSKRGRRTTAQGDREAVYNLVETGRTPRPRLDRAVETFAENPLTASQIVTEEAPNP
jgi:hypothetical protein